MTTNKNRVYKSREYCKKYREKVLGKTKKFFSVRVSKEEGTEIKEFLKNNNLSIKELIEKGTELMEKGGK